MERIANTSVNTCIFAMFYDRVKITELLMSKNEIFRYLSWISGLPLLHVHGDISFVLFWFVWEKYLSEVLWNVVGEKPIKSTGILIIDVYMYANMINLITYFKLKQFLVGG